MEKTIRAWLPVVAPQTTCAAGFLLDDQVIERAGGDERALRALPRDLEEHRRDEPAAIRPPEAIDRGEDEDLPGLEVNRRRAASGLRRAAGVR